jgi:hypothetical protein
MEQKLSKFHFEPFHGGENNSEFRSVEQQWKQTFRTLCRSISQKKKTHSQFSLLEQETFAMQQPKI